MHLLLNLNVMCKNSFSTQRNCHIKHVEGNVTNHTVCTQSTLGRSTLFQYVLKYLTSDGGPVWWVPGVQPGSAHHKATVYSRIYQLLYPNYSYLAIAKMARKSYSYQLTVHNSCNLLYKQIRQTYTSSILHKSRMKIPEKLLISVQILNINTCNNVFLPNVLFSSL